MKLTVMGDIGCYTLGAIAPLEAMDACICMGASIGTALGLEKARGVDYGNKVVAVIGDSTFVHSGITALIDVVYNQGTSTVLILDNETTAMTGHQDHPATGRTIRREPTQRLDLEQLVRAIGIQHVEVVDPLNLEQLQAALETELNRREPSVIICRRPCVLIPHEPAREKYYIDQEICNGCSVCIRLGCTGLVYLDSPVKSERKAIINENSCVNCGLCAQVCKFDAIKVVEG
jgi:indolepyruvate ferredoxin oxidoreductase alpha subunit